MMLWILAYLSAYLLVAAGMFGFLAEDGEDRAEAAVASAIGAILWPLTVAMLIGMWLRLRRRL